MAAATAGAPQGTDATISATEDSFRLLSGADFGFVDPDGTGSLYGVIITGMTGGTLYYDADGAAGAGLPVAIPHLPRTFTVDEMANGNVAWRADANVNGSGVGSITFQVIDDEGALDDSANTLTIDVTPVNDAPALSATTDQFVDFVEDGGPVALMRNVVLSDPDMPADFAGGSLRLQAIVPDGSILLRSGSNFLVNDLGGGNFEIAWQDGAAQVALGTISGYGSLDLAITGFTAFATLSLLNDLIDDFVYANASDIPSTYIDRVVLTISEGENGGSLTVFQAQGLRLIPRNDAPVAEDDLATTLEDRAVTFAAGELLNNDFDPDNDQLHISSVTAVSGGRVTLAAGGSVIFTPDRDFNGTASFIYVVDDGHGGTDQAEVTVGVADVYDPPELAGIVSSVTLYENAAPVLLDADVDFTGSEGHLAGGTLTISGLFEEDRISIRDQGIEFGKIGVSGAEITYGGIVIGSFAGGLGGTFTAIFNSGVTEAAVEALIENLTYSNVSDFPLNSHRLLLNFTDGDGADIGPAAVPATFTALAGAANPFFGLDLGSFSAPAFVDLDGDGDMDMVVGDNDTDLAAGSILGPRSFRNDGGAFTELTGGANPFDGLRGLYYAAPAFVDLDGDGDLDAVFGTLDGSLRVFANQGGAFSELTGAANTFQGLNIGFRSVPGFADLDGDGDLDLVLGVRQGIVRAFFSDGGKFRTDVGTFLQINGGNPILNLDVGDNSTADFVDLDGDGDVDAVIGAQNGMLRTFRNDGGAFHELIGSANPFQGVDVGLGSNPGFGDLDGDGDMDVVIGAGDGTLRSFVNNMPHGRFIAVNVTGINDAPIAGDDVLAAFEDRVVTFAASDLLGNDRDVDGGTPIIASVTAASGGSVTLNDDGSIAFTPDPDFNGSASFTYVISDGHGGTDEGAVIVNVAAVNDAPSLAGFEPSAILAEDGAPALLDAEISFIDLEGNFDGGTLTVTGLLAEDRVAVRDQGSGSGEIGLSGSDVLYGGEVIGSFSGGVGAPLTVTFNASATSVAVEALIENLTYANGSDMPTASRTLLLNVTDADGAELGTANVPATFVELTGAANPLDGVDAGDMARPAFLDIDGDGDLDAILGRGDGGFLAFRNDGGVFTPLTGDANPFGAIFVGFISAPGFGDLDGDGDMDALVGDADGELFAYRNDGGVFTALSGAANPFDGFYIGIYPNPAFGDLDSDGDMDVLAGRFDGTLRAFANDGGVFTLLSAAANPFDDISLGFLAAPGFVDLDGDGDLDVVIGEDGGTLHAFRNDGGVFTELAGAANPFNGVLLDSAPSPAFGDLDGDGDMDAVVGTQDGTLRAFENKSPRGAAIIVNVEAVNDAPELTGLAAAATFDKILVNTAPQLLDGDVQVIDLDGHLGGAIFTVTGLLAEDRVAIRDQGGGEGEIGVSGSDLLFGGQVIGSFTGGVGTTLTVTLKWNATVVAVESLIENLTYANVSDSPTASRSLVLNLTDAEGADFGPLPLPSVFVRLTGEQHPFGGADLGEYIAPAFVDLDGDGDQDAVIGNTTGTLRSFRNDGSGSFTEFTGAANPFDGVDIGNYSAPAFADIDGDGDMDAIVGTEGLLLAFRNQGGGSFIQLAGAANPFDGVDVGSFSAPAFVDLDGDGDPDLVVGTTLGQLRSFRNNGDNSFTELTGAADRYDGVQVGAYASPGFVDFDGDGDLDTVVGDGGRRLSAFRNNGDGTVTWLPGEANPFNGWDLDYATVPAFADLDGDGDMDAVIGELNGLAAFDNIVPHGQVIMVNVTAPNEAPTLADFAAEAAFLENDVNAGPALLDTDVTFGDAEGNFSGGSLSVTGLLAEDRVAVRDQGDEAGEIGVSGDQISYGGTVIGSLTGGAGDPLTIIFNAAATSVAIDALIENLTYANVSDTPAQVRTLILEIMDGDGAAVGSAIEVVVAAEDDPPILADVAATLDYTENDAPTAISNALTLTDPDSANLEGATVEIRAGLISEDLLTVNGAPSGTSGAISWVYDSPNGILILTGSAPLADYQALLRQVRFESTSDAPGSSRTIAWTTYDGDQPSATSTTEVAIEEQNDAPFLDLDFATTLPFGGTRVSYTEGDPPLPIAPRAIAFDPDGPPDYQDYRLTVLFIDNGRADDQLTIIGTGSGANEIEAIQGELYFEGVLVGSFTGGENGTALIIDFNSAACGCAVELVTASVAYSNSSDDPSTLERAVIFSLDDGSATNSEAIALATIEVTALNFPPELTGLPASADFAENLVNAAPQLLVGDVTLSDVEGEFGGGRLTVSGLLTEDKVTIRDQGADAGQIGLSGSDVTYGGTIIGTYAGGEGDDLLVTFNADATTEAIEALLENLTYADASDSPTASRTLLVNLTDASGADLGVDATSTGSGYFGALDAPGPFDGIAVFAYAAPTFADLDDDGDLDLAVGDDNGFLFSFENDGGVFTELTGSANPFDGLFLDDGVTPTFVDLDNDGDLDLVVGGSEGQVQLFGNDGGAFVERTGSSDILAGIDVGEYSAPAFNDIDDDGDQDLVVGSDDGALHVFENDNNSFAELTGPENPFDGINVGSFSSPAFVDLDGDGDMDLVVGNEDGAVHAFGNEGGAFTELTGPADPFSGVSLQPFAIPGFSDLDGDGDLDAVVGQEDGTLRTLANGPAHGRQIVVNVTAVDDPALARNDGVSTNEATLLNGNVFANNGSGADSDVDSPLGVSAVNGNAGAVGNQVTLLSGARLILNADGTFSYDPNHAFDATPAPGSGASNTPAHDSFAYAVNGVTTTVTITIAGIDTNDLLIGTAGADTLDGGTGNDILRGLGGDDVYYVDTVGDNVREAVGGGFDRIYASADYTLRAGQEIEILSTSDFTGSTALALGGNEFDNLIIGNGGANILYGKGGNDILRGLGGNDVYYVDTVGDNVREAVGGGFDRIYASADYTLRAGQEIEVLSTDWNDGTANLALGGNELNDSIYGNAGNNILDGKGGYDILIGLGGNDSYYVDSVGDNVVEAVGGGNDRIYASADYTLRTGSEIEVLSTSDFTDTTALALGGNGFANLIIGNGGANILDGKGGYDTLIGLGGDDNYYVDTVGDTVGEAIGGGNDRVYASADYTLRAGQEIEVLSTDWNDGTTNLALGGNELDNSIYGNNGNNILYGKGGNDTLLGLGGADQFWFIDAPAAGNVDTILDFQAGVDEIVLLQGQFGNMPAGTLGANAFQAGNGIAQDADDRILYDTTTGALYFDADGNGIGAAVHFASLSGAPAITANDFQVI